MAFLRGAGADTASRDRPELHVRLRAVSQSEVAQNDTTSKPLCYLRQHCNLLAPEKLRN